jgi:hypothetical protein
MISLFQGLISTLLEEVLSVSYVTMGERPSEL